MKVVHIIILLFFITKIQGGKLMRKLFQRNAKKGNVPPVRRSTMTAKKEKQVEEMYSRYHTAKFDKPTMIRENIAKAEANLKSHYFQGDMMLTPGQQKVLNNAFRFAKKRSDLENRAMIKDIARLWPGGKIPYAFASDIDEEGKGIVNAAIKHWMDNTCVQFAPRKNETDFVEFQFADACASRVGRLGGKQEILIGSAAAKCKVGNLIHELGHTLGFFHEHSRPDRDNYVKVAFERVQPGFEINFKKLPADWVDSRDVAYDYGSILHYPRTIFGKRLLDETVIPLDATAQIGQRVKLSEPDKLQAKKLYGCPGVPEKTVKA